jgi:hypothetical protein
MGCACQGAAAQHAALSRHHLCIGQQGMGVPTCPLRLVLVLQRVAAGHFKEAGWNGIEFTQATNCWASNVGRPAACAKVQHHILHHASLHTCLWYSTLLQLDWHCIPPSGNPLSEFCTPMLTTPLLPLLIHAPTAGACSDAMSQSYSLVM